jgi:FtsP/CotA-like multicopper oxidase with cupredoxin domain
MNKNRTLRNTVAVAAAVPFVLIVLAAPAGAAELAPIAGAVDHLVAATSEQLGQSATLADIGSTNGTTVNGTPVQTWQLADGDVIRVGHSSLVFRTQG